MRELLMEILEAISQASENCVFCGAISYPVKAKKRGYEEVKPEDAEEYHIDHFDDCIVTKIEQQLQDELAAKPEAGEFTKRIRWLIKDIELGYQPNQGQGINKKDTLKACDIIEGQDRCIADRSKGIMERDKQLGEQERIIDQQAAELKKLEEAFAPVADWYGGGTEGNRSLVEMLTLAVADLQDNRVELLKLQTELKSQAAENKSLKHELKHYKEGFPNMRESIRVVIKELEKIVSNTIYDYRKP